MERNIEGKSQRDSEWSARRCFCSLECSKFQHLQGKTGEETTKEIEREKEGKSERRQVERETKKKGEARRKKERQKQTEGQREKYTRMHNICASTKRKKGNNEVNRKGG